MHVTIIIYNRMINSCYLWSNFFEISFINVSFLEHFTKKAFYSILIYTETDILIYPITHCVPKIKQSKFKLIQNNFQIKTPII